MNGSRIRLRPRYLLLAIAAFTAGGGSGCWMYEVGQGDAQDEVCQVGQLGCYCRTISPPCSRPWVCVDDMCVDPKGTLDPSQPAGDAPGGDKDDSDGAGQPSADVDPPVEEDSNEPPQSCHQDSDCEDENVCTSDRCIEGQCENANLQDELCDDQDPCTAHDLCVLGVCVGQDTVVIDEDFSTLGSGWVKHRATFEPDFVLDTQVSTWEIGAAAASRCSGSSDFAKVGEDPAKDHSPGDDNVLAGVVIGDCHETRGDWVWDCLFSPEINTSSFDDAASLEVMRHMHMPQAKLALGRDGVEHQIVLRGSDDSIQVLAKGSSDVVNDKKWVRVQVDIDPQPNPFSIGFCFRRGRHAPDFAGWSIDDVFVAQQGCKASSRH